MDEHALESELRRVGGQLAAAFPSPTRHPLRTLDARALERTTEDVQLRAALLRFVDVVPACRSPDDVARHLTSFLDAVGEPPQPLGIAMRMGATRAGRAALGAAAAHGVRHVAHRFIVGESPAAASPTLRRLWRHGVASSLDLLGEATVTDAEADAYEARCDEALDVVAAEARRWPARPLLEADGSGPIPRANLSVKVSALTPRLRPEAPGPGQRDAARRLRRLLARADLHGAHLHVDMESLDSRDAVLALVLELLDEPAFAHGPSVGVVVQAYLRDAGEQVDRLLAWARRSERRPPLVVRLVKGAYWDHEVVLARQHGWQTPVLEQKAASDRAFEALTLRLLEARPDVRVAVASHNLRSVAHAIACDRLLGGSGEDLELQVLRGLGDDLASALAAGGLRVRSYCPVGDLVAGMAYLVRRLLENTANDSFLSQAAHGEPLDRLLARP
ncbi:proline dehydrogenase family protein [Conexibacter woesei]|uniref:Proline dehydrogenase n=1 Tax=Conexibacter woesei (strain DSM 14684 / CCUG 47730 / CIP 108061 / JCM 11494 / NBRC 100937 / ID131577) TaxID=469383 RepID=D3FDW7_CONWI|nr:proline dehydrogenase family protein [Conexibacter woesei]ADB51583.1 Proline dehydrogenase [Conexibacter woesei DSM 14684]